MIIQKNISVSHAINQFAKLFQGYFSLTCETIIERKLCDLRVSVVSNYRETDLKSLKDVIKHQL